jgi:hypothetical protein
VILEQLKDPIQDGVKSDLLNFSFGILDSARSRSFFHTPTIHSGIKTDVYGTNIYSLVLHSYPEAIDEEEGGSQIEMPSHKQTKPGLKNS